MGTGECHLQSQQQEELQEPEPSLATEGEAISRQTKTNEQEDRLLENSCLKDGTRDWGGSVKHLMCTNVTPSTHIKMKWVMVAFASKPRAGEMETILGVY